MKTRMFLFLLLVYLAPASRAQEVRISISDGMVVGCPVDNYHYTESSYDGFIEGGWRKGVGVGLLLENSFELELFYYYQDTKVPTTYYTSAATLQKELEMTLQWLLLGFTAYISKKKLRPFFGTHLGVGFIELRDDSLNYTSSKTRPGFGATAGLELGIGKVIALKLKTDVLFSFKIPKYPSSSQPVQSSSNSDLTSFRSFLQTGVTGSLVIRFGVNKNAKKQK